ncbi:MAG: hypothetical protein M1835_006300 [Candelina submexicana]|nr:MAG: hypothetical protein M1835_006300 [Candelina submexicana]
MLAHSPASSLKTIVAAFSITVLILYTYSAYSSIGRSTLEKVQSVDTKGKAKASTEDKVRAQHIVNTTQRTFYRYRERAWSYDDVMPVSGGHRNTRNGWGAFIVDTSTTLVLMGLWDELQLSVDYIVNNTEFTRSKSLVDPFETTIRYLGALVSLTDLIDSGVIPSTVLPEGSRDAILAQAVTLGNKLAPSFDSPTGMLWPRVNFTSELPAPDPPPLDPESEEKPHYLNPAINPARAGSNFLENYELSRLSKITGYITNATRAWSHLVWNESPEEWPGIVEGPIDIFKARPVGSQRSWDGSHDSYYEYLIKAYILASTKDPNALTYRERWIQAAESLRTYLSSRATLISDPEKGRLFICNYDNGQYINEMGHLAHFAAGNLILGGRHVGREDLVSFGIELLETAHHSYNSTLTGIGPERVAWMPAARGYSNPTGEPDDEAQREKHRRDGDWITDPAYHLRPEYVESLFYAWRITGEQKYKGWAWDAYVAVEKFGYAAVKDVTKREVGENLEDESESFWGAETLKYLYLIFANSDVGGLDDWVYTTEAHPIRIIR